MSMTDLIARFLEIPMTKMQKEQQHSVVKAELIPSPVDHVRAVVTRQNNNTSICCIQ